MSLRETYLKSLKLVEVEELVDLILYRPIAFILAVPLVRTPVTPNMVTIISALVGISGGVFLAFGRQPYITIGALLYATSHMFDCMDGMLARMANKFCPYGRIYDGVADYIVGFTVMLGIGIGCQPEGLASGVWWSIVVLTAVFTMYQGMYLNHVREAYLKTISNDTNKVHLETPESVDESETRRKKFFLLPFIVMYRFYLLIESSLRRWVFIPDSFRNQENSLYQFRRSLFLSSFTGKGTHVTLLTLFLLFEYPLGYCWVVLVPCNLYLIAALVYHRHIVKKLRLIK